MNDYHDKVYQNFWHFLAFGFGTGTFPNMPGTIGTLAALPLYLYLCHLAPVFYLTVVFVMFLFGIWLCGKVGEELNYHDYPGIVWDEIVGYLLTLFMLPVNMYWMIAAFVLFRIFDIWKPGIIGRINKNMKGGFGVMIDDVLAAALAWLILQLAHALL